MYSVLTVACVLHAATHIYVTKIDSGQILYWQLVNTVASENWGTFRAHCPSLRQQRGHLGIFLSLLLSIKV